MEWLSLHDDVLTKVLVTVHAGSEELVGSWLLIIVEWLSLHDDVLTKVLVTVHTGGEKSLLLLLVVVEWLALHDDVLTKIFITVHASGEVLVIWDAGNTSSGDSRSRAS